MSGKTTTKGPGTGGSLCTVIMILLAALLTGPSAQGKSTIAPDRSLSWSPSIGWVDWHPSEEYGARIGEFVCAGYLWSPNIGWIHLGDGKPANGVYYSNDSADDYGVNHRELGRLRGLAWSSAIGWVVFHDHGDPRVNPVTGELSGNAWMPNAGWLRLGNPFDDEPGLVSHSIAAAHSTSGDGIPDAWRIRYGGNVDSLPAGEDSSGNGMTNRQAYLAGLDPLDPKARFAIVDVRVEPGNDGSHVTVEWTGSSDRTYRVWRSVDLESWEPVGPAALAINTSPYLVGFVDPVTQEDVTMVRELGGFIRHVFWIVDGLAADLPESAIRELLAHPRVTNITLDEPVYVLSGLGGESAAIGRFVDTLPATDSFDRTFYRVEVLAPPFQAK